MSPIAGRGSSLTSVAGIERVEFTLAEFERLIEQHGYEALWSKATMCPNRDPNQDDHHRLDCNVCDGNGFVYYDPKNIKAVMSSFSTKQTFLPESRYEPGTTYVTVRPANKLSFWDRIELVNSRVRYTQVVRVQPGVASYRLRYSALSVEHVVTDKGVVIASASVLPDGKVQFTSPPAASFFTISYIYHPAYVVIDLLHQVRNSRASLADEEQEFPVQAACKLDFLVNGAGD